MGHALLFFRILGSVYGVSCFGTRILKLWLLLSAACIHSFGSDKTLKVRKNALTYSAVPLMYPLLKGQQHLPFMNNEKWINILD